MRKSVVAVASVVVIAGLGAGAGRAQVPPASRIVANPRVLGAPAGGQALLQANQLTAKAPTSTREKRLHLKIVYTDGKIYNPATQTYDKVHLRSYNGTDVSPDTPYVAPTIEVTPGQTVRVDLDNQLPTDPTCSGQHPMNVPHCFNTTNLHSHGLWVSPSGNSDNVLLSIAPGTQFEYEYNIPADHPAGTFWYHTHQHGSTALQVSSGMAGALIVRGDRLPSASTNGDLETLLYQDGRPVPEQVVLFQQIQYACLDKAGNIKVKKAPDPKDPTKQVVVAWVCDPGDVGGIETYGDANGNGFGPPSWGQSGRYTSINGQVLATLNATTGRLARWRLIHAGVRDTINLQIRRMGPGGAAAMNALAAKDGAAFNQRYCTGAPMPFHIVARDGLTVPKAKAVTQVVLQPGYRDDLLIVFPAAGDYCLINGAVGGAGSVSRDNVDVRLLGEVHVAPGQPVADIPAFVKKTLVDSAKVMKAPLSVQKAIVDDLEHGLGLSRFTPHAPIKDAEVAHEPKQQLLFNIDVTANPTSFQVGSQDYAPRPYDATRIDRTLTLGHAQEWELKSEFASHPFHIHVNPFEIIAILDPNGKDVSAEGAVDDYGGGPPDPNYPGLKGAWKDTLWVKAVRKADGTYAPYTVVVRTRYERYIGEFVLHCHILDHEDQGMMQNVLIALPGAMASMAGMEHH